MHDKVGSAGSRLDRCRIQDVAFTPLHRERERWTFAGWPARQAAHVPPPPGECSADGSTDGASEAENEGGARFDAALHTIHELCVQEDARTDAWPELQKFVEPLYELV